jgi:hypothetical protein
MVPTDELKLEDDEKYSHFGRLSRNGKASSLRSNPTFLHSYAIIKGSASALNPTFLLPTSIVLKKDQRRRSLTGV